MTLAFNLEDLRTIEFGLGRDDSDGRTFTHVPVDANVQSALSDMAQNTWSSMAADGGDPLNYEPSERYGSTEYVTLPLDSDHAVALRQLHQADNLPVNSTALDDPSRIFTYFARLTDGQGRRLTALRRAIQFKGVLKNRLIRFASDALKIVDEDVFKLDNDFDLLIDADTVHILRPSGFEFVAQLQTAILAAVPQNIQAIQTDLSYVAFEPIEEYARAHPRAARYLASIRTQNEFRNIDRDALGQLCAKTGVQVQEIDGTIVVDDGHIMGFLEVLDRRRFEIDLVRGSPEQYRAPSRRRL